MAERFLSTLKPDLDNTSGGKLEEYIDLFTLNFVKIQLDNLEIKLKLFD